MIYESTSRLLYILSVLIVSEASAQGDVITVIRSGDDTVKICSSDGFYFNESCASGDFTTYMVEDKECVNDTTLTQNSRYFHILSTNSNRFSIINYRL